MSDNPGSAIAIEHGMNIEVTGVRAKDERVNEIRGSLKMRPRKGVGTFIQEQESMSCPKCQIENPGCARLAHVRLNMHGVQCHPCPTR